MSDTILPEHVKFEQIANLRSIEDKCLPLRSIYDHLARVLKCLKGLGVEASQAPSNARSPIAEAQFRIAMENFEHQLSGFMENAALLLTKVTSVSQFLSDTLTFKQNQLVLKLTHLSVNDSAAVRVITILTLIYLPATAIAVSSNTHLTIFANTRQHRPSWICHFSPMIQSGGFLHESGSSSLYQFR